MKYYCKASQYCGEYKYYDWWKVNAHDQRKENESAAYDDPCENEKMYGLPMECNWTGKAFQYHNWTFGVVQLQPSGYNGIKEEAEGKSINETPPYQEMVNTLAIGIYKGEQGKRSEYELGVASFNCPTETPCLEPYSFLQTSAPGLTTDNHIAVDMYYFDTCTSIISDTPCLTRRLWGFESSEK